MSYSPASYTLLGISLTLATLSLVGTGGVKWWYLKELSKADKDDRDDDMILASCRSSADDGDDASAGLDLHLSQDDDDDSRVLIEGDIERNNADGLLQVLLSSDSSCTSPSNFIASIFSGGSSENEIEDWTIARDQLDDLSDAIGDVIVVRDSGNDQIGCCVIRRRRSDD